MQLKGDAFQAQNDHLKMREVAPVALIKDDPRIPDFYQITVELRNGEKRTFEAINYIPPQQGMIEIHTVTEEIKVYPVEVICEISFDPQFYKLLQVRAELLRKQQGGSNEKASA